MVFIPGGFLLNLNFESVPCDQIRAAATEVYKDKDPPPSQGDGGEGGQSGQHISTSSFSILDGTSCLSVSM